MFHMGWFHSFNVSSWNTTWSGDNGTEWMYADKYVEMGRSLERAGFDYMMLEDGSFIPDVYGGTMEHSLRTGLVPKHDPMALVSSIGQATSRIGIIATVTTSFYPPFLAARALNTLDHLTEGRVGANLVTAHNERTAQNYGLDQHYEHDQRYEMADEWVQVVTALWDSWEPGSLTMDESTGMFADHTKVHHINFEGKYYRSRGPLNTVPSPQGRPVICQAGGSPAGQNFAAKHADTVIGQVGSVAEMKAYRDEISRLMLLHGRDPKDCKVLFMVSPILADTDEGAQAKAQLMQAYRESNLEGALAMMSFSSGRDFSKFDLDEPMPQFVTNNARSTTALFMDHAEGRTLRQVATAPPRLAVDLVGSPATVAAKMGEAMEEAGGDGYLISLPVNRLTITEIADGLAPELRKRGLIRENYSYSTLRENLLEF
jgi:FMN-dependent oxidoreductase (nitrilotriacetate monooxygenase family)